MSVIVYKDVATVVAFLNQFPVVPATEDAAGSVALACAMIPDPDTGETYYDFTATIDPDIVAKCASVDGRRAQAYPFSPFQIDAINAEISYLVGANVLNTGDVQILDALPNDWQWPETQ